MNLFSFLARQFSQISYPLKTGMLFFFVIIAMYRFKILFISQIVTYELEMLIAFLVRLNFILKQYFIVFIIIYLKTQSECAMYTL